MPDPPLYAPPTISMALNTLPSVRKSRLRESVRSAIPAGNEPDGLRPNATACASSSAPVANPKGGVGGGGRNLRGGVENRPIDDGGGGGVPEWSIGSPSSKGPSMLGLFGGVTSPIFTNDFRFPESRGRSVRIPMMAISHSSGSRSVIPMRRSCAASCGSPLEHASTTNSSSDPSNFTGSRGVFSRASAGHKRKSLVKIGEVTPPKRPPILGPLELGEPVDHSGTVRSRCALMSAKFAANASPSAKYSLREASVRKSRLRESVRSAIPAGNEPDGLRRARVHLPRLPTLRGG